MHIHDQMQFCVDPPFVRLLAWLLPLAPAARGASCNDWHQSSATHSQARQSRHQEAFPISRYLATE